MGLKRFIFSVSLFMVFTLFSETLFAMTPTFPNNAKFTRGVGNTCYYIGSGASGYTSLINTAMYNWEVTGYGWNPIYQTGVSSNYGTHIDFYGKTPSTDSYLTSTIQGYASFWNNNGTLVTTKTQVPTYNYFYSEIILNTSNSTSYSRYVLTHEIGHAFGLSHNSSSYSIMCPNATVCNVTTVQNVDHQTINYLYN